MFARSIPRNLKLALTCRFEFTSISAVVFNLLSDVRSHKSDAREQKQAEKELDT